MRGSISDSLLPSCPRTAFHLPLYNRDGRLGSAAIAALLGRRRLSMNDMSQRDLQQHIAILGWFFIVSHAVFLAIGGFVFLLLIGLAPATGEPEPMWILGVVGTAIGLLF